MWINQGARTEFFYFSNEFIVIIYYIYIFVNIIKYSKEANIVFITDTEFLLFII